MPPRFPHHLRFTQTSLQSWKTPSLLFVLFNLTIIVHYTTRVLNHFNSTFSFPFSAVSGEAQLSQTIITIFLPQFCDFHRAVTVSEDGWTFDPSPRWTLGTGPLSWVCIFCYSHLGQLRWSRVGIRVSSEVMTLALNTRGPRILGWEPHCSSLQKRKAVKVRNIERLPSVRAPVFGPLEHQPLGSLPGTLWHTLSFYSLASKEKSHFPE